MLVVHLFGGGLGVSVALAFAFLFTKFSGGKFSMEISPSSVLVAFAFSTLIGVVFGFMPARNAARLDPVEAAQRRE